MKSQVMVDWLTFSVKEEEPEKVIREYLGLDPGLFQEMGYGLLGYNRVLRFSDICVCYEGRENSFFQDMGVCVSMSGNGCRTLETMSRLSLPGGEQAAGSAFLELFRRLSADESANISRIDIACDDREGILDMEQIVEKVRYRDLGLNIAYYRKLRGLSQEKLAEKADISRTHMSRIETADCAVSLDVVFNIADALCVEPYKLFQSKE